MQMGQTGAQKHDSELEAMKDTRGHQSDSQRALLEELVNENVSIAGDIAEIGVNTWAIHGVIPVDGDVIIAEFDTYEQAKVVLNGIATRPAPGPDIEWPSR
jgi:hypothetical protein